MRAEAALVLNSEAFWRRHADGSLSYVLELTLTGPALLIWFFPPAVQMRSCTLLILGRRRRVLTRRFLHGRALEILRNGSFRIEYRLVMANVVAETRAPFCYTLSCTQSRVLWRARLHDESAEPPFLMLGI